VAYERVKPTYTSMNEEPTQRRLNYFWLVARYTVQCVTIKQANGKITEYM